MPESEKQLETREQPKTKIVHIEYGEYADQQHEILEVPADWDIDKLEEQYKKEKGLGEFMTGGEHHFIEWLIEKGAKNDVVESYYVK